MKKEDLEFLKEKLKQVDELIDRHENSLVDLSKLVSTLKDYKNSIFLVISEFEED